MEIFEVCVKGTGRPVAVFGAPYDATTIYRRGSAQAPDAMRNASISIETYSMRLQRDLSELNLQDHGDLLLRDLTPAEAVDAVANATRAIVQDGAIPVMLGGEHTMSLGAVRAVHEKYPDLKVVVVDAHFDLRDSWEGASMNHATWARRAVEMLAPNSLIFVGVRSAAPEELEFCASRGLKNFAPGEPGCLLHLSETSPVYLSVDYDGLDPGVFPATGNPEPLGLKIEDLLMIFSVLARHNVVGMDFVEYNPDLDPGTSAVVAAWLIREALLEIYGGE
ncbi:MAG: agmatinase [bacterium JZ-2024 1]